MRTLETKYNWIPHVGEATLKISPQNSPWQTALLRRETSNRCLDRYDILRAFVIPTRNGYLAQIFLERMLNK